MSDDVPPAPKRTLKERLKAHFAEYGRVAVWTYLALSISTIIGFSIAIGAGVSPSSATGVFGVIGAGWVAAKATMPLRILATLALTPLIATVVERRKRNRPPEDDAEDDAEPAEADAPAETDVPDTGADGPYDVRALPDARVIPPRN